MALDTLVESAQLAFVEGVSEAEHGPAVANGGELLQGRRADALGGGVGCDQLGVGFLQLLELAKEAVVVGVADLRGVEDVVAVVVVLELAAQLLDSIAGFLGCGVSHGRGLPELMGAGCISCFGRLAGKSCHGRPL